MKIQTKLWVCFSKINNKHFFFFFGDTKVPLIPEVETSPNTKNLFLRLSGCDDELLSTPKSTTFQLKPLSKLSEPALSNFIPYPLYTYFSLLL